MNKAKSLCKFKKAEIEDHLEELRKITRSSDFICKKCARSANSKKWLCKPVPI